MEALVALLFEIFGSLLADACCAGVAALFADGLAAGAAVKEYRRRHPGAGQTPPPPAGSLWTLGILTFLGVLFTTMAAIAAGRRLGWW